MKENNEQLRSAEEIAYATWRKLVNQNWANVAGEIQTAIEEYAEGVEQELKAKFKSQLPIEQKTAEAISLLKLAANIIDDCNRYMGANLVNGEIEQFFIRYKDYQFKSQPLPIEGVEREQFSMEDMRKSFFAGRDSMDWDEMAGWVTKYAFDQWLATRKGSKSGE